MTVREILLCLCIAATFVAVARICFLLAFRRTVLATTVGTDYSDADRLYERDWRVAGLVDNAVNANDVPIRSVLIRARYSWDGVDYAQDVSVYVRKGNTPDRQVILWINPDDPETASASGIGVAMVWIIGISVFAVAFWQLPF